MSAVEDVVVSLPSSLSHLGKSTRARAVGDPALPAIVALGGISANRFVADGPGGGWWTGLGRVADPAHYRVVGLDFAADESGRAAPTSEEQARVLCAALDALGIERAEAVIAASYGGMVALALARHFPERLRRLVAISAPATPHPASTAARELQRRVVALALESSRGAEGLAIARGLAMLTYRTREEFGLRFEGGIGEADPLAVSEPGRYLRARGEAYQNVMSPGRFLSLSAAIDRHRVDPSRITIPVLVIGATSDIIVPAAQTEALAAALPDARLHILDCLYGHDMFLKEADKIGALAAAFLEEP
ncbi:MAG TPA: alpha/beta fold hydrolase [Allosphingosinicella sp.]|nr:alpha/beta fold hydrolase [Allosphingosinicella sp.]